MKASPPEKKARSVALNDIERRSRSEDYCSTHVAQIIPLPGLRPCVSCGVLVGNLNLGGYNGRSALSGKLFCLKCADRVHEHDEIFIANRGGVGHDRS
jgi:hypothetical protein